MSEMIEQVAKAMWDARRANANNAGIHLEFWGDGTIPRANGIMDEARAAIEAMREPTDEMALAIGNDWGPQLDHLWKVMIDRAMT